MRCLIIEDDEIDAARAERALRDVASSCTVVRSLEEALFATERWSFDVALLDLHLPDSDGTRTVREFVRSRPELPVVVLTGDEERGQAPVEVLRHGAQDWVSKSDSSNDTIVRAVRYAVERRRSERYRGEKEIAERSSRLKSELLSNVSHEIRTPLTAILGYAELLAATTAEDESRESADVIQASGAQLLAIVDDILDLAAMDSGRLSLDLGPCSPGGIAREVVDSLVEEAEGRRTRVTLRVAPEAPGAVVSDGERVRQILRKLVENAVRFTEDGEVEVEVGLEPADVSLPRVSFRVRDTGPGIVFEKREMIFEPFCQVDTSSSRAHGGTGLGLAIAKRLATALGGSLVFSEPDRGGSEFRFDIPAVVPPSESASTLPGVVEAASLASRRVLVVEDVASLRELTCAILTGCGASVDTTSNGKDALRLCARSTYDVILMDLQMPVVDGLETARQIQRLGVETPIIAVTARATEPERGLCRHAGFADYVTKPFTREELVLAVAAIGSAKAKLA